MAPAYAGIGESIGQPKGSRNLNVDVLKAVSIVAVVAIHSLPYQRSANSTLLALWLSPAVPVFLACSGFLCSKEKDASSSCTTRRLARVLSPYVVATLAAWALRPLVRRETWWAGSLYPYPALTWGTCVKELLFCSAVGPYYFVFVLVVLFLLEPCLRVCPRWLAGTLIVAAELRKLCMVSPYGQMTFWGMRDPVSYVGYFLCGLVLPISPGASWKVMSLVLLFAVAMVFTLSLTESLLPLAHVVWNYVCCLWGLSLNVEDIPRGKRLVVWLSSNTYTVFLYHYLFAAMIWAAVEATHKEAEAPAGDLPFVLVAVAGFACSCGLAFLAPALLGPDVSKHVFGCVASQNPWGVGERLRLADSGGSEATV